MFIQVDIESLTRYGAALCCRRFHGSHTYDRIAEILNKIITEYEIPIQNIVATVTDNGRNFVKAFAEFGVKNIPLEIQMEVEPEDENSFISNEIIGDYFQDNEAVNFIAIPDSNMEESGQSPSAYNYFGTILSKHIRCACHTLSLVATTDAQTALKFKPFASLSHTTMGKCSALWNKGGRPKSFETIHELIGCSLKIPCITRWNSLYDSILVLLKFKSKLNELMASLQLSSFTNQEIQFLEEYKLVLSPIACALDRLQGDTVFYGEFLPTLLKVNAQLEEVNIRALNYCSVLLTAVTNGFKSRFSDYLNLTPLANDSLLASVSHPYFKLRWIKAAFGAGDENKEVTESKKCSIRKLFISAARGFSVECDDDSSSKSSDTEEYFDFEHSSKSKTARTPEMMVMAYLNDTDHSLQSLKKHPLILDMFLRYNTTVPSSAPVERLFSFAGLINSPRRERISDELFERLLMLKANSHIKN